MTNINTILKNRKNKKGFSLIELIVVLVIMAILAAALVPSLIGYINQSRNNTAINEAASVVSAAQTVVSSAYADPNMTYHNQSDSTKNVVLDKTAFTLDANGVPVILALAEVKSTNTLTLTIGKDGATKGVVTDAVYTTNNGIEVTYDNDNSAGKGTYYISK